MNAKKILARVIEMMFPEKVAQIRKTNRDRRAAMQLMLDVNRRIKDAGGFKRSIDELNLRMALRYFNRGRYTNVIEILAKR